MEMVSNRNKSSSRARGGGELTGSQKREKQKQKEERAWVIPGEERETFLNVLNFVTEGKNRTFNKLLGAPAILLGAPSNSRAAIVEVT